MNKSKSRAVEGSIHPQAIGWWILAALAALVGLAVVGQALARQSIVESEDYPTMAAIGADRRQLVTLGMVRNLVVAIAGAAGAVAVATALSPIAPLGEARIAETSTGVTFDTPILLLGALATVAVVLALGLWPALRAAHTLRPDDRPAAPHPSAVVGHLAATGAPPSAVIGVRNAIERKSGGAPVPVGSALLGTVLAVIALCGTAVFGASLSHLTATPRLYGNTYQLSFGDLNTGGPNPAVLRSLEHNRAVTGIMQGIGLTEISVNKVLVGGVAGTPIRGRLSPLCRRWAPSERRQPDRSRCHDDAPSGRTSGFGRPRHGVVAVRWKTNRAVPGGFSDLLPGGRRRRRPGYGRRVHHRWL